MVRGVPLPPAPMKCSDAAGLAVPTVGYRVHVTVAGTVE